MKKIKKLTFEQFGFVRRNQREHLQEFIKPGCPDPERLWSWVDWWYWLGNQIQEKAKTEYICDDCGREIDDDESYWEIAVTKEKAVYNSIESEWGESFRMFCEGCAQDTDLFVLALETIRSVVKSEFRDKIVPMEGTYVPSEVKSCPSCGSRKA